MKKHFFLPFTTMFSTALFLIVHRTQDCVLLDKNQRFWTLNKHVIRNSLPCYKNKSNKMVNSLEKNKIVFIFFYNVLKRLPPKGLENSEMCSPGLNLNF